MDRVAVFIDAGYLLAQGSVALMGVKQPRSGIVLREQTLLADLETFALACEPGCSFLRIYWYDGLVGLRETAEQSRLAESPNVKLRMGTVNSAGDQKGVDSLIVTDLVDLARAGAISGAVVLAGDEDVRIGVEIAQRSGVRVHLLGVVPSRGSQSRQLLREADTTTEWDAAKVSTFLTVPSPVLPAASGTTAGPITTQSSPGVTGLPAVAATAASASRAPSHPSPAGVDAATEAVLAQVATVIAASIRGSDVAGIITGWDAKTGLDHAIDSRLLAQARNSLGRDLDVHERRPARRIFVAHLRTLLPPPPAP